MRRHTRIYLKHAFWKVALWVLLPGVLVLVLRGVWRWEADRRLAGAKAALVAMRRAEPAVPANAITAAEALAAILAGHSIAKKDVDVLDSMSWELLATPP